MIPSKSSVRIMVHGVRQVGRMYTRPTLMVTALLVLLSLISGVSAVTLSGSDVNISGIGASGQSTVMLDSLPGGLAGVRMTLSISDVGLANITAISFPAAFDSALKSTSSLPSSQVTITLVDLYSLVEPGSTNVVLWNMSLQGLTPGSGTIQMTVNELTDDNGSAIAATLDPATIIVGSVPVPPTATPSPTPTLNTTPTQTPTTTPTVTPTQTPTTTPTVTPTQTPVVNFTGYPTSGRAPLSVVFTPDASGSPEGYVWYFGDGTSSDKTSPTRIYQNEGIYSVTMLAKYAGMNPVMVKKNNYITVTNGTGPVPTVTPTQEPVEPLVANFTATPVTGHPPLSVQFTDTSKGHPTKWRWNFGDGYLSTSQNPVHVYSGLGRYTITLEAENRDFQSIERKFEFIKTVK